MADTLYGTLAPEPPGVEVAFPSLVVQYPSRAEAEDARFSYEVLVVSTDGGRTWEEEG